MHSASWSQALVRLAIMCMLSMPALARAQTTTASVTGTVHDSSGAIVPGAAVLIRNHATSQTWESISDARGSFRLQLLPVGDYHLSVQLSGFTTATANLTLRVGDQIDVPIVLKPAAL
ncbi:MAG: carboxypeptidase regulatory-like domain-containing protein, partial [Acidobacteria bacterium]|nr:carboxypeptidase regulatory-like domain-containing protein [Acidobacteriota bacterium]